MKINSHILIFAILVILSNNAYSQTQNDSTKSEYSFEIGVGFCKPTGSYLYSPGFDNTAYALSGISLFIAAKNDLKSHVGFKYLASAFINPADNAIYSNNWDSSGNTLSVKSWTNINFGIGPYIYYQTEDTRIEAGLSIGLLTLNRPKITYLVYENGSVIGGDKYKKGIGFGFCFIPEVSISQKISDRSSLKIFLNYQIAPSYVEYKKQHYFIVMEDGFEKYIWNVSSFTDNILVSTMNLGIGITF